GCWFGPSCERGELERDGEPAAGALSQLLSTPPRHGAVWAPARTQGGAVAEDLETARRALLEARLSGDARRVLALEAPLNARLGAVLRVPFEPTRDDVLATALLFLFDGLYAVPGGGAP